MLRFSSTFTLWFAAVALTLPSSFCNAATTVSIGESGVIQLPFSSTGGVVNVLLRADGLSPEAATKHGAPRVTDANGEPAGSVEFESIGPIDFGAASQTWLIALKYEYLPVNTNQTHYARVTSDAFDVTISYILTNLSPANLTWSVAQPSQWFIWFGFFSHLSTAIVVTSGDYPIGGLRLAQSSITSTLGGSSISLSDLELSESPNSSTAISEIPAHTSRTVYLGLKATPAQWLWRDGNFTGTVSMAISQRPDLQTVNLTVHASSLWARLIGAAALIGSLFLAWWLAVWSRARLARLQAWRAVLVFQRAVRQVAADLKGILDKVGGTLAGISDNLSTRLATIDGSLSADKLDTTGCLPVLGKVSSDTGWASNLQTFLKTQADQLGLLRILVDGMAMVLPYWNSNKDEALKALQRMYGAKVASADEAHAFVDIVLKDLETAVSSKGGRPPVTPRREPSTVQRVDVEVSHVLVAGWVVWGTISLVVGMSVLVMNNPGFGGWSDLVFCLLWGFGLPTTADRLQQLTPGGIATQIGVSFPSDAK